MRDIENDINNIELTEDEIKVAKIQAFIKGLGYQWLEHRFNDGYDEVYIEIAITKETSVFINRNEDAGWGRFDRLKAWRMALEWILNETK